MHKHSLFYIFNSLRQSDAYMRRQSNHRNSNIFIQENAFESVVCEVAAILSRP